MTRQTNFFQSLGGSQAGAFFRLRTLTLGTVLGSIAVAGYAQEQQPAAKTAEPPPAAKAAQPAEKKPASPADGKVMGGYQVHSMIDLGGQIVDKSGSSAMWATMVNQTTGARVLGQELRMHTLDPHKTPFFDTLNTSSFGYGGDPYDATYLTMTKGKWYDFAGNFRRDRQYFDYNLMVNSLLGPNQLVPQPSTLHLYNTVRYNTDTLLTLMPVSVVSFRAGYNHNTHEGPAYSTIHQGGDVQEYLWFRNGQDTYVGGVDVKLTQRSTLSYDQFLVYYRGDTSYQVTSQPFVLPDGTPVNVGVNLLTTSTCGTSGTSNFSNAVVNGVVNPYCSGTFTQSESAPTRTSFPTEQLRFASHSDKVSMNGRLLYSGGTGNVKSFNETFIGFNSRSLLKEQIDTGAYPGGKFASNKRIDVNGDYNIRAEVTRNFELSDTFNYWDIRVPGNTAWNDYTLTGVATQTKPTVKFGTSLLTPLTDPSLTPATTANTDSQYLGHKNIGNTILGTVTVTPEAKLSAGWRFNDRQIKFNDDDTLTWHQNWMLLGGVVQPSRVFRLNVNYDMMWSQSSNSTTTPSDTYTREAPNKIEHLWGRALVKPAKWINLAVAGGTYSAENNDPLVNHKEHNQNISFGAQLIPAESMSLDFNYGYDDVFSVTDLCYATTAPPPTAIANTGTCAYTAGSNKYLGNGYYDAPVNYFTAAFNYSSKYFRVGLGGRFNDVNGSAEMLSPYQVPGALQSKYITPYADLAINIAPQWSWHGNWNHPDYNESGPAGPATRDFKGDIFTLGVKYAF
jgi:hypothetical protein